MARTLWPGFRARPTPVTTPLHVALLLGLSLLREKHRPGWGDTGGGGRPRLGEQEGRRSVKKTCGARKGRGGAVGGAFSASKLPGHRGGPLGWKDGPAPDFWATARSKDIRDREASVFCVVGCSCFLHFRSLKKWSKQSRKAKPDEFLIQTVLHFAVLKYF